MSASAGRSATSASARNSWWVGLGILLSRISGIVRDAAVAYYLGSGRLVDIFFAGLRAPNLLQNLLGEGSLSASFIPVYARFLEEDRSEDAGRFAGAALGLLAATAYGAALLGMALAPLLARLLFPTWDPDSQLLLTRVLRILFPMTATLVLSAWALGILNSHRRFFVSYVAPVAWNVALITALFLAAGAVYPTQEARGDALVMALAWGGLAGGVLQFLVQIPFMGRALGRIRPSLGRGVTGVREAVSNLVPVVLARGAVNLSAYADIILAGLLVAGAVGHLGRAQALYLLPISLFGMAVAAAELPELSRQGPAAGRLLAERVRGALGRVRFLLIPSAVAYLAFGDLLVAGLYERGSFGAADSRTVGWVLAAYALGLPASGSSRTLSSAFYALRDTRTPARIAFLRIGLSLGTAVLVMFPLDRIRIGPWGLGAAGLGVGASVAAWVEYGLLRRRLADRIGEHGPAFGGLARALGASVVAAAAAWVFRRNLGEILFPADLAFFGIGVGLLLKALGTAAVFGVVYLVLAGLGVPALPSRRRPGS
ncbi:MAG: murein biosynthesis integral membrane protein MurJ [Gemmatimonadales bacterium]|nr:MAG: murein biosynthesis integral membrane protein MurJ [Gemmatimonadales bacterium]